MHWNLPKNTGETVDSVKIQNWVPFIKIRIDDSPHLLQAFGNPQALIPKPEFFTPFEGYSLILKKDHLGGIPTLLWIVAVNFAQKATTSKGYLPPHPWNPSLPTNSEFTPENGWGWNTTSRAWYGLVSRGIWLFVSGENEYIGSSPLWPGRYQDDINETRKILGWNPPLLSYIPG